MTQLTLIEKAFFLKKTALFSELDLDLVLAIADKAEERRAHATESIFVVNQDAHRLYVLVKGTVSVLDDDEKLITTLQPPDFFGDESLFNQRSRDYSVQATGDVTLLTIARTHLIEVMLESPQVAISLIRAYAAVTKFRRRSEELIT